MSHRLKEAEQMAVQAKLASCLGSHQFLSLFADLRILDVERGTLEVRVGSLASATVIETTYGGLLAVIVESVVRKPVRSVRVLVRASASDARSELDRR